MSLLRKLILIAVLLSMPVVAQESSILPLYTPVAGEIDAAGDEMVWRFYAFRDDVLTFRAEAVDAELDPVLTIRNLDGVTVIANDDAAYPGNRDALLEAVTIPRTGDYAVVVTGFGGTTGGFELTMLAGYGEIASAARFISLADWEVDPGLTAEINGQSLTMMLGGVQERARVHVPAEMPADFHAMLDVNAISGRNGWAVGLGLRQQTNGDHYALLVNALGQWRLTLVQSGEERSVRDWSPHPAIVPGEESFSLGVLVNGTGFDVFYDRQYIGSVTDDTLPSGGGVAIIVETANALGSGVSAVVNRLVMTMPTAVGRIPEQIIQGDSAQVARALARRRVIPAGGQLMWSIEDSSIQNASPGVNRVPLLSGSTYTTFVLGTTATQTIAGDGLGACGLLLRNQDDTDYMVAFLDNVGGYGISQRTGDQFQTGVFGEQPTWRDGDTNDLVVVALDDRIHLFINGHHGGTLEQAAIAGGVGNVLINFDPVDTACQFTDTWLWSWPE